MGSRDIVVRAAGYLQLPRSYALLRRKLTGSQVAILLYHRVAAREDNWSLESVSPETFEQHIKYLRRSYEFLSLNGLAQCMRQEKPLPQKAVVVTFDDGYKDNYLHAYPILKKYSIPATIFLTSGHIGTGKLFWWDRVSYFVQHATVNHLDMERLGSYLLASDDDKLRAGSVIIEKLKVLPEDVKNSLIEELADGCRVSIPAEIGKDFILSWDEVMEMNGHGIEFGAHSVNHPVLVNLPPDEARWEISQSKKDIEEKLRQPVTTFAYPNGAFNSELATFIEESDFTCAVAVRPGRLIKSNDGLYGLNRIEMNGELDKCEVKLCGLLGDLRMIPRRGK